MWQQFREPAKMVVFMAQEESRKLSEGIVGPGHLLLAILRSNDPVAIALQFRLGLEAETVRAKILELLPPGRHQLPNNASLGIAAKSVINHAYDEARDLKSALVGPEHMLLGIIRADELLATELFLPLGVTLESARKELMVLIGSAIAEPVEYCPWIKPPLSQFPGVQSPQNSVLGNVYSLHPIDQMLLSMIHTKLPKIERCSPETQNQLAVVFTAIVGSMEDSKDEPRAPLDEVLEQAQSFAEHEGRAVVDSDDLFQSVLNATAPSVRKVVVQNGDSLFVL